MKVLKIEIFRRVQNALSCNILKQIEYCNRPGCLYLAAKDELFSPNGFFLIMKNFEISVLTGILDSRSAIYS